jgi:hypothetical protein
MVPNVLPLGSGAPEGGFFLQASRINHCLQMLEWRSRVPWTLHCWVKVLDGEWKRQQEGRLGRRKTTE